MPALAAVDQVKVTAIPSVTAYAPNKPFDVAIKFDIAPGWHTYWSNPGQSGQAPTAKLQLPEGWKISGPVFPAPHTFVATGGIEGYGYADEAAMVFTITPDDKTAVGSDVQFAANVSYLVCDDQRCVPGNAVVNVTVKAEAEVSLQTSDAQWWQHLRDALPRDFVGRMQLRGEPPAAGATGKYTADLTDLPADFAAATDIGLYPPALEGGEIHNAQVVRDGGTIRITFDVERYAGTKEAPSVYPLTVGYTDKDNNRRAVVLHLNPG